MKLVRKKTGDRAYDLVDKFSGSVIAHAVQTGETGRDNYPWDWQLMGGREFGSKQFGKKGTGVTESLKNAVDLVKSNGNHFGILIPDYEAEGYAIKAGDFFRYGGYHYQALADATGEFNAYVKVLTTNGESEIVIGHGHIVTIYKYETSPKE